MNIDKILQGSPGGRSPKLGLVDYHSKAVSARFEHEAWQLGIRQDWLGSCARWLIYKSRSILPRYAKHGHGSLCICFEKTVESYPISAYVPSRVTHPASKNVIDASCKCSEERERARLRIFLDIGAGGAMTKPAAAPPLSHTLR